MSERMLLHLAATRKLLVGAEFLNIKLISYDAICALIDLHPKVLLEPCNGETHTVHRMNIEGHAGSKS